MFGMSHLPTLAQGANEQLLCANVQLLYANEQLLYVRACAMQVHYTDPSTRNFKSQNLKEKLSAAEQTTHATLITKTEDNINKRTQELKEKTKKKIHKLTQPGQNQPSSSSRPQPSRLHRKLTQQHSGVKQPFHHSPQPKKSYSEAVSTRANSLRRT